VSDVVVQEPPRLKPRVKWGVRLGVPALRALTSTWRVDEVQLAGRDVVRQNDRAVIFCLWHGEMLMHFSQFRDLGIVVLNGEHADAEIAARLCLAFGYGSIRGSSSKGGGRALLALSRELSNGRSVAITPDGPRGPPGRFTPGAVMLARHTGAPIVPLRASASPAWRLPSWDRFILPLPYSRVKIVVGAPITVDATSPRDPPRESERFEQIMRETGAAGA